MASLRELESLKNMVEVQQQEINEIKRLVFDIKSLVHQLFEDNKRIINKPSSLVNDFIEDDQRIINKPSSLKEKNYDLSLIFTKYKQSLLIKNKYNDKNTTLKCKNVLKELGAKWFKNQSEQGWLFVSICKDTDDSIEEISKFIVDKLNENKFNLEIEYQ